MARRIPAWLCLGGLLSCALHSTGGPGQVPASYLVYVRDREGSVVAAVDEHGQTVATRAQDGFGLTLAESGQALPRGFLDQESDPETGFIHFRRRYYDPATAQWVSPDPKLRDGADCSARVQGCNPYAFAGDRPLEWTDPDGREITYFAGPNGQATLVATLGFTGPDAAEAQKSFTDALADMPSSVRVIAVTALYKTVAEIPPGLTRVIADRNATLTSDPGYFGSQMTSSNSTIQLSRDAFEGSGELPHAVVIHELMHAAGLDEGYSTRLTLEGREDVSKPGEENSFMGNFYEATERLTLTHDDLAKLSAPVLRVNGGLDQCTADFGKATNMQATDTAPTPPTAL